MKADEAKVSVDAAVKTLSDALAAGKSDNLKAFLAFGANFTKYSFRNQILIYSQMPTATRVATYRKWQSLGRQVKKGEKAMYIFVPCPFKKEQEDGTIKNGMFFKTAAVFDVSQTEGDALPDVFNADGDPGVNLQALEDACVHTFQVSLYYVESCDGALGRSFGGKIEVVESLTPAQKFSTLAHEIAHELLHDEEERKTLSKTVKELEAEAVAFIICQHCGVDTLEQASDYIQMWQGNAELLTKSLSRIQKAAQKIIESMAQEVATCS